MERQHSLDDFKIATECYEDAEVTGKSSILSMISK